MTDAMLDTNTFDAVLEGRLPPSALAGYRLFVVGVQRDELSRAPEPKRSALLATFNQLNPTVVPAASFCFDIEGAGMARIAPLRRLEQNGYNIGG